MKIKYKIYCYIKDIKKINHVFNNLKYLKYIIESKKYQN